MSKVYVENKGITLAQQDREAIASHLEKNAAKNGPGSIAGDLNVTVNGTTYSGTVLVAGARQTITFTVRSKAAAPKKNAKKK